MRWAACPAVPPVTKQEYVSQNARERLFFAEKIADYLDTRPAMQTLKRL